MAFLSTILIGGIGAAITNFFQAKYRDHQEKVKEKEAELAAIDWNSTLNKNISMIPK